MTVERNERELVTCGFLENAQHVAVQCSERTTGSGIEPLNSCHLQHLSQLSSLLYLYLASIGGSSKTVEIGRGYVLFDGFFKSVGTFLRIVKNTFCRLRSFRLKKC